MNLVTAQLTGKAMEDFTNSNGPHYFVRRAVNATGAVYIARELAEEILYRMGRSS